MRMSPNRPTESRPHTQLGTFDLIFLRNVLIYFDAETKRAVVARVASLFKGGGIFIIAHSESLNGLNDDLALLRPSVHRKP